MKIGRVIVTVLAAALTKKMHRIFFIPNFRFAQLLFLREQYYYPTDACSPDIRIARSQII